MLQGFDSPRRAPARPGVVGQAIAEDASSSRAAQASPARKQQTTTSSKPAHGKQIPYLNVVTNFSKPNPNPSPTFPPPIRPSHERSESLQERRRNGRLNGGSRSRLEALKAGEPVSGLSPSDRELMIGWSIPGPPNNLPRMGAKRSLKRLQQSRQPSIAITLAATSSTSSRRGRATSSIYSRLPTGNNKSTSVPPVPAVSRYSLVTSIETSSRCTSWATDFSEDDTLQHSRPESRDRLLKRDSSDSLAAKHQSKGWWNHVLSPFEERFELTRDIRLDHSDSELPQLVAREPETTPTATNDRGDSTVSSRRVTTSDDPDLQSFSWRWNLLKRIGMNEDSPEIFGKHGMGLAVEYFEACWHDQNRPTPYFTCENHTCSYGKGNFQGAEDAGIAGPTDGEEPEVGHSRGLDGTASKDDVFQQTPQNRFSKDFAAKIGGGRPKSSGTVFEEDFIDTPIIQDARAAPVVHVAPPSEPAIRAALRERHQAEERVSSPSTPPAMTPSLRTDFAENRALQMETKKSAPATTATRPTYPPRSDSMDRAAPAPAPAPKPVPMPMPLPASAFSPPTPNDYSRGASMQSRSIREEPVTRRPSPAKARSFGPAGERGDMREINDSHPTTYFPPPPRNPRLVDDPRSRYIPPAREESPVRDDRHSVIAPEPKKAGFFKRTFGRRENVTKKERKKRRCIFCWIFLGLLALVIGIVVAVVLVTLPRSDMAVQTAWLNVTGYPPVPTGISTVVRPNVNVSDGCISPPTMWSCALPKELQPSIAPNPADRPNFRIEIRFQNGTALTNNATFPKRSVSTGNMSLRQFAQTQLLRVRDTFTNNLFSPSPPPPGEEDQEFLGNTTDQVRAPFAGEETPFFMSFVDAGLVGTPLYKRQTNAAPDNSTNATDPFPDLTNDIPPPSINSDGTAASANLHPFPTAQPLRLYNRGRQDEHYGFYTYFDRSIFLKSASVDNITEIGVVPDDENGGATESEASLRCTWAQTRFLVQIWTNTQGSLTLLGTNSSSAASAASTGNPPSASGSSANNFTMPGSFPYPVSITLDRHGGDIESKSVYCYGMDDREHILKSERKFQLENRSFGGTIVNPALGLFAHINVSRASGGPGGIDGGTGGCSCLWRNFEFGN